MHGSVTGAREAYSFYLVVQYLGELKDNLWDYKGILLPPERLKVTYFATELIACLMILIHNNHCMYLYMTRCQEHAKLLWTLPNA